MPNSDYELVVFDGDETLIDGDIIHALGSYAGVGEDIERIQERVSVPRKASSAISS